MKKTKTKTITLFLFCLVLTELKAQTLTPQVLSTAGTSFVNGTNVLDWTLGEPATFTLDNGTNLLTQGFHQNDLLITEIDNTENSFGVTVFPNPTADFVQIQFDKATDNNVIELFSVEGKLLLSETISATNVAQINMSNYANGTYLLKVNKSKTYQIIKN